MWIKRINLERNPIDQVPIYAIPNDINYNLDDPTGCDKGDFSWQNICSELQYNGAVFMKQGLYHCSIFYHNYCPGSRSFVCENGDPGFPNCKQPSHPCPSNIPTTPIQTIFHDVMTYLKCSDIPDNNLEKNKICDIK